MPVTDVHVPTSLVIDPVHRWTSSGLEEQMGIVPWNTRGFKVEKSVNNSLWIQVTLIRLFTLCLQCQCCFTLIQTIVILSHIRITGTHSEHQHTISWCRLTIKLRWLFKIKGFEFYTEHLWNHFLSSSTTQLNSIQLKKVQQSRTKWSRTIMLSYASGK